MHPVTKCTCTHIIHDGGPALHGDTLEHRQHSEADVVEACDAVVGPLPEELALRRVPVTLKAAGAVLVTHVTRGDHLLTI